MCLYENKNHGTRKEQPMKKRLQTEKEKIQEMETKQAAEYIWTYYKIPIVGILVFLFLLVYFIHAFLNRPEDTLLHITFINCYDGVSETSGFYKEYGRTMPLSMKREPLPLTPTHFLIWRTRRITATHIFRKQWLIWRQEPQMPWSAKRLILWVLPRERGC